MVFVLFYFFRLFVFFVRLFVRETQEEETRLWDWCLCCCVKMAEGTKSLYLSAAPYFSANFVTVTNQKLVAHPWIT